MLRLAGFYPRTGERRGVSPTWMLENTSGLRLDAHHGPDYIACCGTIPAVGFFCRRGMAGDYNSGIEGTSIPFKENPDETLLFLGVGRCFVNRLRGASGRKESRRGYGNLHGHHQDRAVCG